MGAPHQGPLSLKTQMKFLLLMSFYLLGSARGESFTLVKGPLSVSTALEGGGPLVTTQTNVTPNQEELNKFNSELWNRLSYNVAVRRAPGLAPACAYFQLLSTCT